MSLILDKLECFFGPPLQTSFAWHYHFNEANTKTAIEFYRKMFKEEDENELYPEVPLLLKSLKEQWFNLVVTTFKPTVMLPQRFKEWAKVHSFHKCIRYFYKL